eukprot:260652-Pelagomonas_calceolata.AAC.2
MHVQHKQRTKWPRKFMCLAEHGSGEASSNGSIQGQGEVGISLPKDVRRFCKRRKGKERGLAKQDEERYGEVKEGCVAGCVRVG